MLAHCSGREKTVCAPFTNKNASNLNGTIFSPLSVAFWHLIRNLLRFSGSRVQSSGQVCVQKKFKSTTSCWAYQALTHINSASQTTANVCARLDTTASTSPKSDQLLKTAPCISKRGRLQRVNYTPRLGYCSELLPWLR